MTLLYHLDIARGSQGDAEVQLEIAQRLAFTPESEIEPIANRVAEIGGMLNGLVESLPIEP